MRPARVVEDLKRPRRVNVLGDVEDGGDDVGLEVVQVRLQPGAPGVPPDAIQGSAHQLDPVADPGLRPLPQLLEDLLLHLPVQVQVVVRLPAHLSTRLNCAAPVFSPPSDCLNVGFLAILGMKMLYKKCIKLVKTKINSNYVKISQILSTKRNILRKV